MTETAVRIEQKLNAKLFAAEVSPEFRALREDVLNQLREDTLGMAKDLGGTGTTSFAEASVHQKMGDLLKRLGKGEEAHATIPPGLRPHREGRRGSARRTTRPGPTWP